MTLRNYSSTAAETTLSSGVDASTTTLLVSATTGFPSVPFILAVDAGAAAQELVLVTNVAGTTLTVTRAYDSTVASSHDTGAVVAHSHAAIDFREANVHVNAESGVHGVTGDVVGTSDTQTLTNKTLTLGSNTLTGTKAQFNTALTDGDFASLTGTETLTNKTIEGIASGKVAGVTPVASVAVTFPASRFTAAPAVTVTCSADGNVAVVGAVNAVTTAGCTIFLYGVGGTWSAGAITVHWTALGV